MGRVIKYSCDILQGINKAGTLKRDAEGWFIDIVLGALDCENNSGDLYPLASAQQHFESSTALMRKSAKGVLFGEAGHPEFKPGMTREDFISRLGMFPHNNISHAIRNLRLQECINPQTRKTYVAIIGDVLPVREQGTYLEKELLTKDINVCFSIRSLTKDIPRIDGSFVKHITRILSFDWVNEGGIIHAQKYNSPGLEHFDKPARNDGFYFTREEAELSLRKAVGCGMESADSNEILTAFDYLIATPPSGVVVPARNW
jgi:hypothetical protein